MCVIINKLNLGKTIFIEKGQSCLHQDCPTETKGAKPSPYLMYNDKYIISESFVSSIITKFVNFLRGGIRMKKKAQKKDIFSDRTLLLMEKEYMRQHMGIKHLKYQ